MKIRKAKITDVKQMHKLINEEAKKEMLLPRSLNDLYENIRDFSVYEEKGKIKGVCALHVSWDDLAEIRSLVVVKEAQKKGIGRKLLSACLKETKSLGIKQVFTLTYQAKFFRKNGFIPIDKAELPKKIWGECLRCPKFPECDEEAFIIKLQPLKNPKTFF